MTKCVTHFQTLLTMFYLDNRRYSAILGTFTGIIILLMIMLMVWFLKSWEYRRKKDIRIVVSFGTGVIAQTRKYTNPL